MYIGKILFLTILKSEPVAVAFSDPIQNIKELITLCWFTKNSSHLHIIQSRAWIVGEANQDPLFRVNDEGIKKLKAN